MGGLQDGECSTKFVLEGITRFWSYDLRDLCDGVFLGENCFVCSIFDNFDDIAASMLLEREDV
jgi:hypothetical protein